MERFLQSYTGKPVLNANGEPIRSADKDAWAEARLKGVTATDINKIVSPTGKLSGQRTKLLSIKRGEQIDSNFHVKTMSMTHGNEREPIMLGWAAGNFDVIANDFLFHGEKEQYLATPDGLGDGYVVEVKSSIKTLDEILGHYMNQMQWQMHVIGVPKVLFIVEQHKDYSNHSIDYRWIEKDEDRIKLIVENVDIFIKELLK